MHLIHVGFPKAASTALQGWFAAHPQMQFAVDGLGGHYNASSIALAAAAAVPRSRCLVTSSEHLLIPRLKLISRRDDAVDPIAVRRRRACVELQTLFGDPAILIVTRGFAGAIASSYSQYVRAGGTGRLPRLFPHVAGADISEFYAYDAMLALYREHFSTVIVLPWELLRDDPAAFTRCIEAPLGLDAGPLPPRVNTSLSPAELYWYPRLSALVRRVGLDERYRPHIGGRVLTRVLARAPRRTYVPSEHIPEELLQACRGRAAALAQDPLYAPYAAEYLNSP